jgi:hypothetical protein
MEYIQPICKVFWVLVAHVCNPSYAEMEIGNTGVQGQPRQPIAGCGSVNLSS